MSKAVHGRVLRYGYNIRRHLCGDWSPGEVVVRAAPGGYWLVLLPQESGRADVRMFAACFSSYHLSYRRAPEVTRRHNHARRKPGSDEEITFYVIFTGRARRTQTKLRTPASHPSLANYKI